MFLELIERLVCCCHAHLQRNCRAHEADLGGHSNNCKALCTHGSVVNDFFDFDCGLGLAMRQKQGRQHKSLAVPELVLTNPISFTVRKKLTLTAPSHGILML